jgi:hypothetical protein
MGQGLDSCDGRGWFRTGRGRASRCRGRSRQLPSLLLLAVCALRRRNSLTMRVRDRCTRRLQLSALLQGHEDGARQTGFLWQQCQPAPAGPAGGGGKRTGIGRLARFGLALVERPGRFGWGCSQHRAVGAPGASHLDGQTGGKGAHHSRRFLWSIQCGSRSARRASSRRKPIATLTLDFAARCRTARALSGTSRGWRPLAGPVPAPERDEVDHLA